jgi:methionyl-tRNA formyltransferase
MKYAFFGTPEFAAIILEKLIKAGMPPMLVVCNPDKPVGRKQILAQPPTKILARKYNVPVFQPEKLEIRNLELEIEKLGGVDFAIVVAYAKIIPKAVLDLLPAKFLGVHPSLLPKYRGATPIQSVILAGEEKTGVTLFLLDEKVDHGPILAQRELEFSISNFQFSKLLRSLAELSGDLLIEILPKFARGEVKPAPQNESEATYTRKFTSEDGFVPEEILRSAQNDGGRVAIEIERKIRALNPEPSVYTMQNGKRLKLLEAELVDGKLRIKKIQEEGGRPKSP